MPGYRKRQCRTSCKLMDRRTSTVPAYEGKGGNNAISTAKKRFPVVYGVIVRKIMISL